MGPTSTSISNRIRLGINVVSTGNQPALSHQPKGQNQNWPGTRITPKEQSPRGQNNMSGVRPSPLSQGVVGTMVRNNWVISEGTNAHYQYTPSITVWNANNTEPAWQNASKALPQTSQQNQCQHERLNTGVRLPATARRPARHSPERPQVNVPATTPPRSINQQGYQKVVRCPKRAAVEVR